MPEEEPPAPTNNFHHEPQSHTNSLEAGAPASHQTVEERRTEPGTITMTPCTELFKKFLLT